MVVCKDAEMQTSSWAIDELLRRPVAATAKADDTLEEQASEFTDQHDTNKKEIQILRRWLRRAHAKITNLHVARNKTRERLNLCIEEKEQLASCHRRLGKEMCALRRQYRKAIQLWKSTEDHSANMVGSSPEAICSPCWSSEWPDTCQSSADEQFNGVQQKEPSENNGIGSSPQTVHQNEHTDASTEPFKVQCGNCPQEIDPSMPMGEHG